MEEFRLRVRYEPRKGHIWELHLLPQAAGAASGAAPARRLGSTSTAPSIAWMRDVVRGSFQRLKPTRDVESFGPTSEPVFLPPEDGMRVALALSAAHYLVTPAQRNAFRERLAQMPNEVLLYWFTLCFYGDRTAAGRAALRTLLTHEEPGPRQPPARKSPPPKVQAADLFALSGMDLERPDAPDGLDD